MLCLNNSITIDSNQEVCMADPTLLELIQNRFGVTIDPDSDGGQILNSLMPNPPSITRLSVGG